MKALESKGMVTPRDYSAYVKFHIVRGKYYRLKAVFIILSLVLLSAALALVAFATGEKSYLIIAGIILLCMLMFVYTINVNVKKVCASKAKTVLAIQQTIFGKNGFVFNLLMKNEEENEHDEIFYDELECVYETKTAVYLYIEKRSVIILPKRNLNMSPDEAREFLRKFIPAEKLIICA